MPSVELSDSTIEATRKLMNYLNSSEELKKMKIQVTVENTILQAVNSCNLLVNDEDFAKALINRVFTKLGMPIKKD
jgi:hypothetical protein